MSPPWRCPVVPDVKSEKTVDDWVKIVIDNLTMMNLSARKRPKFLVYTISYSEAKSENLISTLKDYAQKDGWASLSEK